MKLMFNGSGRVYLNAEEANNEPNYWKSKLAFLPLENQKEENIWEIERFGSCVKVDLDGHCIYFPENTSSRELCYALRVVIDTLQLLGKRIPFHAAGIDHRNHCVLIFANSGEGKSYLTHLICASNDCCHVIGDDHIYLLPGSTQGNMMCRLRNAKGVTTEYIRNVGYCLTKNTVGICFSKAEENSAYEVPIAQWYEWLERSDALKYASLPFKIQGNEYHSNELFRCNVDDLYKNALKKGAIQKLFMVKGNHAYAVDCIRRYMHCGGNI